jgi:hypothetical protein
MSSRKLYIIFHAILQKEVAWMIEGGGRGSVGP